MAYGASGILPACNLPVYRLIEFPNVTPCPPESIPDPGWPTDRANE